MRFGWVLLLSLASAVYAHYTFPSLIAGGATQGQWVNVRRTNNYQTNNPVTDVTSPDLRCYNSAQNQPASTYPVTAGSTIGIAASQAIYHNGVANVYMAKAPGNVSTWDGSGNVWFKVYQIPPKISGGAITFPTDGMTQITFPLPRSLPNGEYLVRVEHIALHQASNSGGAQFYISCAQVSVTGGGSGSPGPLVAIPGVYTGREPGIMINIYYPIPTNYTQPGPAVWSG